MKKLNRDFYNIKVKKFMNKLNFDFKVIILILITLKKSVGVNKLF